MKKLQSYDNNRTDRSVLIFFHFKFVKFNKLFFRVAVSFAILHESQEEYFTAHQNEASEARPRLYASEKK